MQAGHYSSLLPVAFQHKNTRVRVFQPKVVLLDFHGTISERRWEDKVIFPYVKQAVGQYIRDNLSNEAVQNCIPGLKNESFVQRFENKYEDAPIIDDQVDGQEMDPVQLAQQLGDFVTWQMTTRRATKETQIIERLVWRDGFKQRKILLPLYDDVLPKVKLWHGQYKCRIYVISSMDSDGLKLLFENTNCGNLDQYIAGYWCSTKPGHKLIAETYKRFYDHLNMGKEESRASKLGSVVPKSPSTGSPRKPSSPSVGKQASGVARTTTGSAIDQPQARPVLFVTDSGQEARAASQVNDTGGNSIFECLLINRPGNKRARTYYLSRFQYIDNFQDIEFVPVS